MDNTSGSGTGAGAVILNSGGTLAGVGIISGSVTVNAGGALSPGNPLGALTITNPLTLWGGSITFMQVQHSPPTNNAVNVTGTMAGGGTIYEGGALIVTNSNTSTFAAGDSFKLFDAANYSGAFTNFVLPSLPAGLAWNTSALNVSGALSVVALSSPTIKSVSVSNGDLVLSGTGGTADASFEVLVTTNLVSPQWASVSTNEFDSNGDFSITNAIVPSSPQSFYRLQVQ